VPGSGKIRLIGMPDIGAFALAVEFSRWVTISSQHVIESGFATLCQHVALFGSASKNYTAEGTYLITAVSGDGSEYTIAQACVTSFVIE
jgi:hypothetical protein